MWYNVYTVEGTAHELPTHRTLENRPMLRFLRAVADFLWLGFYPEQERLWSTADVAEW